VVEEQTIKQEFSDSINRNFDGLLEFSFFSGRFAFDSAKKYKSDIDCIVVLNNSAYQQNLSGGLEGFVKDYIKIHKTYNYLPDMHFPGDVLTRAQLNESLQGRGYEVIGDSLHLSPVISEQDFDKPDMDYRIWRNEMCFNNGRFICGDYEKFRQGRILAAKSIISFLISEGQICQNPSEIIKKILEKGRPYFGLDSRNGDINNIDQQQIFSEALIKFDLSQINCLENLRLVNKIKSQGWHAKYLYDWEDLRKIAWEELRKF
jgi:hypothetical protein